MEVFKSLLVSALSINTEFSSASLAPEMNILEFVLHMCDVQTEILIYDVHYRLIIDTIYIDNKISVRIA